MSKMTEPRIEILSTKKLTGKSVEMSLAKNTTGHLWGSFMSQKSTITNSIGTDLYSIQIYSDVYYFKNFNSQTKFKKWAAIEVVDNENIPNGFDYLILDSGLYAVFTHKGLSSDFPKTIQFIFGEWLPNSCYELDDRPHFELLGKNYKNNDPSSEEEVWIPIIKKSS